jgi:hypothetical protein
MRHVLAKFLPSWLTDQQQEKHLTVPSDLHVHTNLTKLSSKNIQHVLKHRCTVPQTMFWQWQFLLSAQPMSSTLSMHKTELMHISKTITALSNGSCSTLYDHHRKFCDVTLLQFIHRINQSNTLLGLLVLEDANTVILWNASNYTPNDTASSHRQWIFSGTAVTPQIL